MLYRVNNITVSLGGQEILSHTGLEIKGSEKIAITGRNGAGKTTLLRFLAGELEAERDDRRREQEIVSSEAVSIEMLRQTRVEDKDLTVEELCRAGRGQKAAGQRERVQAEPCPAKEPVPDMEAGPKQEAGSGSEAGPGMETGLDTEPASSSSPYEDWEFNRIFTGFGFALEDRVRRVGDFSGGEQTKLAMISLLLRKPDILLLDEPTNHLDMKTVEWLEEYLKGYAGAVVFVSHDRFFMDRVADKVYELEDGRLTEYAGNYTAFRQQKLKNIAIQQKNWERNRQEIKRLKELIARFKNKPSKAAFARSRKSILERMMPVARPHADAAHLFTAPIIPAEQGPRWVVDAEHLVCGYSQKPVIELSFRLERGRKVAIVGDNGSGKTTFLKTIAGLKGKLDGKCTIGNRVEMGYFDQQSAELESEQSVYEHFKEHFPGMEERELRQTLAAYLFTGQVAGRRISSLSGGEKARLVLAEIICSRPNFLILDEPTNHMDIEARETLESALAAYSGTILFVSHDRYLISRLADSFCIFEDGRALYYPFDYEHYLERLERLATARRISVNTGLPDMKASSAEDVRDNIMGLMSAEDQARIAGLKAVPKKERHELGFGSSEEAYEDWQQGLAVKALEEAGRRLEEAADPEEYEAALAELTKAELAWYDTYED